MTMILKMLHVGYLLITSFGVCLIEDILNVPLRITDLFC